MDRTIVEAIQRGFSLYLGSGPVVGLLTFGSCRLLFTWKHTVFRLSGNVLCLFQYLESV